MAKYSTPGWTNNASPAINAAALLAMGQSIEQAQHPYGVCSTAGSTAAKTVTLDVSGSFSLYEGEVIRVKFDNANTAASPTLNVNSTGAKAITRNGSDSATSWQAGEIIEFVYDGTEWVTLAATGISSIVVYRGSYVGTGTYGTGLGTVLTFPFKPLLVVVGTPTPRNSGFSFYGTGLTPGTTTDGSDSGWDSSYLWFYGQGYAKMLLEDKSAVTNNVAFGLIDNQNGVFNFNCTSHTDAYTQCNVSGQEYPYLVIGERTL